MRIDKSALSELRSLTRRLTTGSSTVFDYLGTRDMPASLEAVTRQPFTTAPGTASAPTSVIVSSRPVVRSTWRMVLPTV